MTGELDTAAVGMHEMYLSFTRAGFTPEQSLDLVKAQITASIQGNQ